MTDFAIKPEPTLDANVDTLIKVILDGSTSMKKIRSETVDGLNEYIKALPRSTAESKTVISVSVFKSDWSTLEIDVLRAETDVNEFNEIKLNEFQPEGWTPLFDAIINLVPATNKWAKTSPNPPAVMVVIITDGENNRSNASKEQVAAMIKEMETDEKWTFIFLGANQDAFEEGSGMGISKGNTVSYDVGATRSAYVAASAVAGTYAMSNRTLRSSDKSAKFFSETAFADAGVDNSKKIDK